MAKRKSQDPESGDFEAPEAESEALEEALVGDATEEPAQEAVGPVDESDPLAWLLAKIDAGQGPIGILTSHSRKARAAILALDAVCGARVRTLSLDRARLGVSGVEVKAYSAPEQLRGKRLAAAWVQPGASQRLVDLLRRCLQKGGEVLG